MKIKVYQSSNRNIMFRNSNEVIEKFGCIPGELYDMVFEGEVKGNTLEDIWQQFNASDRPNPTAMRSLSVSDVVQIVEYNPETDATEMDGFYFCNNFGWAVVDEKDFQREDPVRNGDWIDPEETMPEEAYYYEESSRAAAPISVQVMYHGSDELFVRTRVCDSDGSWHWDSSPYADIPKNWRRWGEKMSVVPKGALYIDSPAGLLVTEVKGSKDEYPGFYTSVVSAKGDLIPISMTEYDSCKEDLQCCVYAGMTEDEPTDIITIRS